MNHSFNTDIAQKVGVVPAIMLEHIAFWVLKNKANQTNEKEGRFWTFSTAEGFQKYFPYLTTKQIRYALDKLIEEKYLIAGYFNKTKLDRTKWYTLGEASEPFYQIQGGTKQEENPNPELPELADANAKNAKCDLPNLANAFSKNGRAIPDINIKDINKDISSSLRSEDITPDSSLRSESPPNDVQQVFDHWKAVMGSPRSRLDDKRRRVIRNALKHYSVPELMYAIEGCRLDDWSMGNNDRGTKFNGIDIILRDAEHIDKFISLYERPTKPKPTGTFAEYFANQRRTVNECPVLLG